MPERDAGTRTLEPTAQGIERARRRGDVPISRDLTTALVGAALFAVLVSGGRAAFDALLASVRAAARSPAGAFEPAGALSAGMATAGKLLVWPLGLALAVAVVAGLIQTRGLLTFGAVRFDFGRVAPSARRLLRPTTFADLVRTFAAVIVVSGTAVLTMAPWTRSLGALAGASARTTLAAVAVTTRRLGFNLVMAALLLGLADLLWQRWRHRSALRMTLAEAKRERKETEGDPLRHAERERLHRESMNQGALSEVRAASVVIVGVDGVAIALRYDPATAAAPLVVLKGERLVAETMKQVAREHGVPLLVDESLARALAEVREGEPIDETLFEPVAEILRRVMATPGAARRA